MVWKRLRAGLVIGLCTAVAVLAILSGWLPLPAAGRDAVRHAVRRGELQANDLLLHAFGQDRPAGDDVVLAIARRVPSSELMADRPQRRPAKPKRRAPRRSVADTHDGGAISFAPPSCPPSGGGVRAAGTGADTTCMGCCRWRGCSRPRRTRAS